MKKNALQFFFLVFLLMSIGCVRSTDKAPLAKEGLLDLAAWDFHRDGSVNLNGEWTFYWQQLLSPEDFASPKKPTPTGFFSVPGIWNNHVNNGNHIGGNGFATYRLKVKLSDDDSPKAVKIINQSSAYAMWINGKPIAQNGEVGKNKETTTPQYLLQAVPFFEKGPDLDIIIQVANFNHRKGGLWNPIRMSLASDIQSRQNLQWIFDLTLFGCLFIMGVYHLNLYFLRKKDTSTLFFAFFTLVMAIRVLVSGNFYLTLIFPNIPFEVLYKIELLTVILSPLALLLFISTVFNMQRSLTMVYAIMGTGVVFSLITLVFPSRLSGHLVIPNQILILLNIGYMLFILFNGLRQREEGAGVILFGMGMLGLTAVADILNANRILYTIQLAPFGVLCLIFSQSFVLSVRFTQAFKGVEKLSGELKQKNIALERMGQIKDEFLANTSHELKTPLNGIIGLAESIRDNPGERFGKSARQTLGFIIASGKRLSVLINDLLDFSRLKNKDIRLDKRAVDIRVVADAVLAVSEPLAKNKELILKNKISKDTPLVHGDESRLYQILHNLVGNAVKYTDRGEVHVTARQKGAMVEIRVKDTGIGIAEKNLDTIFKSFEQVEGSDNRSHNGVGLGLSITKHLVELHQGTIGVSSVLDCGTTFYFTLPVSHEKPGHQFGSSITTPLLPNVNDELPLSTPVKKMGNQENGPNILVVDDDPVNLQVVESQLSILENINIHKCMNGPEALDWIDQNGCPDLLLLDIMMPQMTGYEVCRVLRQQYTSHQLPILILTAKNRVSDLTQGFEAGANDYLAKPFDREELLARVTTQLDLKQSYEALRENLKLKKEIEQRKLSEMELRMMHQRLSRILNTLEDAILVVNEERQVTFCNARCEKLLGYEAQKLLGQAVTSLFPPDDVQELEAFLDNAIHGDYLKENTEYIENIKILQKDKKLKSCRLLFAPLEMDDDQLLVMVIQKDLIDANNKNWRFDKHSALGFVANLNKNRQRIQLLEETLNNPLSKNMQPDMTMALKKIDTSLSQIEKTLIEKTKGKDRNNQGVHVMTLALQYWQAGTGLSKTDLAKKSGLWKVYMNQNGFERTQTLDKYLDPTFFPKRPRWPKIFQTADFVLSACSTPSQLRFDLENAVVKLQSIK